jgi:hypothetical protein
VRVDGDAGVHPLILGIGDGAEPRTLCLPRNQVERVAMVEEGFVIVQIGNAELDKVCDDVIFPAIVDAGLEPRRVDRHNEGDLLKSEIVEFIERAQIIVADVTNERPNCYLEIGYAMGLGKNANLILTAREDHHHSSPRFNSNGPKVHFDLEGYDLLLWDPNDLPAFRAELAKLISRRVAVVTRAAPSSPAAPEAWREELRSQGERGLHDAFGFRGYMEVTAEINPPGNWSQAKLLEAVTASQIATFGWSVGVVLNDQRRPRPTSDGVIAEVASDSISRVYDLWKVFRDGRFYTLMSLFEADREADCVFWDSRIHRTTESLLFLLRLYRQLGASDNDQLTVKLRHAGLSGRVLKAANRTRMTTSREGTEDLSETTITATLSELESDLCSYVRELVGPLFVLFDFFDPSPEVICDIVENYVAGRVT